MLVLGGTALGGTASPERPSHGGDQIPEDHSWLGVPWSTVPQGTVDRGTQRACLVWSLPSGASFLHDTWAICGLRLASSLSWTFPCHKVQGPSLSLLVTAFSLWQGQEAGPLYEWGEGGFRAGLCEGQGCGWERAWSWHRAPSSGSLNPHPQALVCVATFAKGCQRAWWPQYYLRWNVRGPCLGPSSPQGHFPM